MSAKLSTKVMPYGNYYVKKWYNVLNGIESDSETVILPSKNDDCDIIHINTKKSIILCKKRRKNHRFSHTKNKNHLKQEVFTSPIKWFYLCFVK